MAESSLAPYLEFRRGALRVRTDFFTRPPRISASALRRLWKEQEDRDPPFVGPVDLALLKQTDREKDYAVIGELARLMVDPKEQLLFSRSARDLMRLGAEHVELARRLSIKRPLLRRLGGTRQEIERELDAERRASMRANEQRLSRFERAARRWRAAWVGVDREIAALRLIEAHRIVARRAVGVLPFRATSGRSRP
ncbi:MAG: hypothetical protein HYR85_24690 [Planctomycetes bacterium]|nr:hypothetical protein [Planctomycetota bacterium]MBI3846720.1 hypothetical protein [Planctomycetota bacterium]